MTVPRVMQAIIILCALFVASASATPSCPNPCKCFTSHNGIQVANCTDLPDQMTTAWPQKNLRIHFGSDHASPVMLKNKAFKHFPRLTYLDITGATIQYVGNSAFDGLPELVELNLVGTGIRKLHRNTFASNRKLAFLSLKNNPRLFIAPSFLVSESITELDLSECSLTSLKSVYFKSLPNLKYLFAMKNELKVLGSQFGPPGIKYVNLAHNRIEDVRENLESYKRLRTIDLTGNPMNCTCELSEIDRKLTAKGVAFGNTITCKNTGKPLGDMAEVCGDKEMMGDDPVDIYKADGLLKIDTNLLQSMEENDDFGSGSGSGDDELFTAAPTPAATNSAENNNTLVDVFRPLESVDGETTVRPSSSENPDAEVAITVTAEPTEAGASSSEDNKTEESTTTTTTEGLIVADIAATVQTSDGNLNTTVRTNVDGGIVPQTIHAPEDGSGGGGGGGGGADDDADVQTKIAEYLKTNVGITGTAVVLAVVIIAIAYKAVCVGKRQRSRGLQQTAANEKSVELKEIKYIAADTEDPRDRHDDDDDDDSPADSVEENLLGAADRDTDDDDGDEAGGGSGSPSPSPAAKAVNNGRAQNGGLLNSVMDAVKSAGAGNEQPAAAATADVPTRVIVKLGETPRASKPVAINNVH